MHTKFLMIFIDGKNRFRISKESSYIQIEFFSNFCSLECQRFLIEKTKLSLSLKDTN